MGQPNQKLAAQLQQQPQNGTALTKGSGSQSNMREPPQKTPPPPPNALNLGDHMIYSNDMKPVSMDDFEMLKVIGRGQFAKVPHLAFFLTVIFLYLIILTQNCKNNVPCHIFKNPFLFCYLKRLCKCARRKIKKFMR